MEANSGVRERKVSAEAEKTIETGGGDKGVQLSAMSGKNC